MARTLSAGSPDTAARYGHGFFVFLAARGHYDAGISSAPIGRCAAPHRCTGPICISRRMPATYVGTGSFSLCPPRMNEIVKRYDTRRGGTRYQPRCHRFFPLPRSDSSVENERTAEPPRSDELDNDGVTGLSVLIFPATCWETVSKRRRGS